MAEGKIIVAADTHNGAAAAAGSIKVEAVGMVVAVGIIIRVVVINTMGNEAKTAAG